VFFIFVADALASIARGAATCDDATILLSIFRLRVAARLLLTGALIFVLALLRLLAFFSRAQKVALATAATGTLIRIRISVGLIAGAFRSGAENRTPASGCHDSGGG
jgi:hypothetical protein